MHLDLSPVALATYAHAERRRQYEALVAGYISLVSCRTFPPDDAYAWTRALVWEAKRLALIDLTPPKCD